jgi:peroxiredoxin family protein
VTNEDMVRMERRAMQVLENCKIRGSCKHLACSLALDVLALIRDARMANLHEYSRRA